jgi:beta-glucosidase
VDVSVSLTNTGQRAGAEVVQCYVSDEVSSMAMPEQQLAAFAKLHLQPGQSETVKLTIQPRAFQYYDPERKDWRSEKGTFEIRVGTSSRQLPLRASIEPLAPAAANGQP